MKKVLLINSPLYNKKVADKEDYLPPYGLGYIATNLKENNINVKIIDAVYMNYTLNELLSIIETEKPTAVGINIFSVNFELVKTLIEQCKTKTKFIVGGKSTRFLNDEIMDFNSDNEINIVIGEGEYITKDIVNDEVKEKAVKNKNNRNVYLVNNNSIYFPANLDNVYLDRTFFKDRAIINPYGEIEEAIVTSRECLYNCAFCGGARSLNSDVAVRTRSKENIINELKYIQKLNSNTKSIRILDDLFLKNRASIIDAINIFKQFDFNFRAMSHIKSLSDSWDLLEELKLAGCTELEIGIESGSDKIRKLIHKVGSVDEVKENIKKVLSAGINVKGYIMYGLPDENIEDCIMSYELAKELYEYSINTKGNFRASSFQFRPYHGTELYNKINAKIKYEHNDNLDNLTGRQQFNFTAGNFSNCPTRDIENFVILTNKLGDEEFAKSTHKL